MDIAPVSAIGTTTRAQPVKSVPDLSRVFEVEYLGQSGNDEYTPWSQKASRGLEDESEGTEEELLELEGDPREFSGGRVSFFA